MAKSAPSCFPPARYSSQIWSPDGNQLAYVLRQGDSTFLQVVPAFFGGVPTQSIALQPAPNDVRLLRWIDRAIYAQAQSHQGRSLYRIDLNAGQITNLTQTWTMAGTFRYFDVSPDGTQVAFTVLNGGQDDLWVARGDGTSAKRLTNDPFFDNYPLFSGNGSTVIFRSNRGGQIDLWRVDVATGRFDRLTSSPSDEEPESTTQDGKLVSFRQMTGDSNLFTWDPSRNVLTELTDGALSDLAPSVSADGSSVVFQRSRPSPVQANPLADSSLFRGVMDRGRFRSEPTALIDGHAPRLSPDGSRVAYLQKGPDRARASLFVKHLGSGETIQLSSTCPEPLVLPGTQ